MSTRHVNYFAPRRTAIGQIEDAPRLPGSPIPTGAQVPLDTPAETESRVSIDWGYLFLGGLLTGVAFALGSGAVNRFVFGKK